MNMFFHSGMKNKNGMKKTPPARRRPKSDPGMEPNAYKTNSFLNILQILRVPTAAVRARQDRRGPSLRPCLKSDPEWSRMLIKLMVFLLFYSFRGPDGPAASQPIRKINK